MNHRTVLPGRDRQAVRMVSAASRKLLLIGLGMLAAPEGHAQGVWRAAAGVTYVLPAEAGKTGGCSDVYRIGVLQRVGRQIAGSWLTLEGNLRSHLIATSEDRCVVEPLPFPPPDGTYIVDDRVAAYLTSRSFAGDLRLRATLPASSAMPMVRLGYGRHWQDGSHRGASGSRPYWVAGVGVLFGSGPRWRVGLEGEYQVLRDAWLRREVSWADGQLTGNESLGTFREWLRASGITITGVVMF